MMAIIIWLIFLGPSTASNCGLDPMQYPIVLGGLSGDTSILTFTIEQSTNSVLIGGTSGSNDLTGITGSTAFAAYIDEYARQLWFVSYSGYQSVAVCDSDKSTSPNKLWCLLISSSNNIIIANILTTNGQIGTAYKIGSNTQNLEVKRNDLKLAIDPNDKSFVVSYHPTTSSYIILAKIQSSLAGHVFSPLQIGYSSSTMGIRKILIISNSILLGGMIQCSLLASRGAFLKLSRTTGAQQADLLLSSVLLSVYVSDMVQLSSATSVAALIHYLTATTDMNLGQNVYPSQLSKVNVATSSVTVTSSVYINVGFSYNVMATIAYDSTNSFIYVIYFNPQYALQTPIILQYKESDLSLLKSIALNWGSASGSTSQMSYLAIFNPLDGYIYYSGFTSQIQGAVLLPKQFGFLNRYSFTSTSTGTCQTLTTDMLSTLSAFSLAFVPIYLVDILSSIPISTTTLTLTSVTAPTSNILDTFYSIVPSYQICQWEKTNLIDTITYKIFDPTVTKLNTDFLKVVQQGYTCTNLVQTSFSFTVNGVALPVGTTTMPFQRDSSGISIFSNQLSSAGTYQMTVSVYLSQLLVTETVPFVVIVQYDSTILEDSIAALVALAISQASLTAAVPPSIVINTTGIAPTFSNWNLSQVSLYYDEQFVIPLPVIQVDANTPIDINLLINGTQQTSNANFQLVNSASVQIIGSALLANTTTKLGVLLQESNTVQRLSSYQDFSVKILPRKTETNPDTPPSGDNTTNSTDGETNLQSESNLTASVTQVFTNYTIDVYFSLPIIVYESFDRFKTDNVLGVTIKGGSKGYRFVWDVIYMDPQRLQISLSFRNANIIGIFNQADIVTVEFLQKQLFRDSSNGKYLSTNSTQFVLPSQRKDPSGKNQDLYMSKII